jgi:hypothetical protein
MRKRTRVAVVAAALLFGLAAPPWPARPATTGSSSPAP